MPMPPAKTICSCAALSLFVALGCTTSSGSSDGGTTSDDGGSSTSSTGTTAGNPVDADSTTAALDTSDASDASTDTVEGSSEGGFLLRPDIGVPTAGGLGEECDANDACESGSCFMPFGPGFGLCSECENDESCQRDGGPGTCAFVAAPYGTCTDGEAGVLCGSETGCAAPLLCVALFEGGPQSFCSECATDEHCAEPSQCTPSFALGHICADPQSLPLGDACPGEGSALCASGHCTPLLFRGGPSGFFGCGACTLDEDCDEGQVCAPATIGMQSIEPSACV
ncbi:MAG: hypothetical protein JKY37_09680 [Nannocystaceae bacterium]|nr:hypothetical protein [Nannocystaceae bacterium]